MEQKIWEEVERVLAEKWSLTLGARFEGLERELQERFGVSLELRLKQVYNAVFLFKMQPPTDKIAELLEKFERYMEMDCYLGLFTATNVDVYRSDMDFADVLPFEKFYLRTSESKIFLVPLIVLPNNLYVVLAFEYKPDL